MIDRLANSTSIYGTIRRGGAQSFQNKWQNQKETTKDRPWIRTQQHVTRYSLAILIINVKNKNADKKVVCEL